MEGLNERIKLRTDLHPSQQYAMKNLGNKPAASRRSLCPNPIRHDMMLMKC